MDPSRHLLAIDCATLPASVALVGVDGTVCELVHRDDQRADAWLGRAVQRCLQQASISMEDIGGFAACIGPGAFTGIRVGIATALGYAAPSGLPVCGVRSVDALALLGAERGADVVAACIDARRDQVYAAIYTGVSAASRPPLEPLWGPTVCDPEELRRRITVQYDATLVIGSGARLVRAPESSEIGAREGSTPPVEERGSGAQPGKSVAYRLADGEVPLAAALGRLALRGWPSGSSAPSDWPAATPLYLRPPDARPPRNPLREARRARTIEPS